MNDRDITLWDFIQENDFPWAVQIIQNIIAISEVIPLRLYDCKKSLKMWENKIIKKKYSLTEIIDWSKNPVRFCKSDSCKFFIDHFQKRENSPWVTRPSYAHPLIDELRRISPLFRTWEHIYIYSLLIDIENSESKKLKTFFDHMRIGIKKISINSFEGFLVAGPVFTPPPSSEDQYDSRNYDIYDSKRVSPFIDQIINIFINTTSYKYKNEEIYHKFRRIGLLRPWFYKENFSDNLDICSKSFETVLNTNLASNLHLRRSIYRKIACSGVFLNSHINANNKKDKPIISQDCDKNPGYDHEPKRIKILGIKNKDERWGIHVESIPTQATQETIENRDYRELKRKIFSAEENYIQEKIGLIRESFDYEYSFLAVEYKKHNENELRKNFYDRLTREVAILLNADRCKIYTYKISDKDNQLKREGFYPKHIEHEPDSDDTEINGIGEDREKRGDQSIIFRAIDTRETHFCQAVFKNKYDKYEFDPTDEIVSSESLDKVKSAIYAPLKIYDRVLGAIGVLGSRPYQFRFHNKELLSSIAQAVSPYIYQNLLLSALREISSEAAAINNEKDKKKLYHMICKKFSEIFLSYAAVLWLPKEKEEESDQYQPVGWTDNRSKLEEQSNIITCDRKDKNSILAKGWDKFEKNGNRPFVSVPCNVIEDKNKPHRKWLKDEDIENVTIIPIFSSQLPKTGETSSLTAFVALYHRYGELEEQWGTIVKFMADFLALLLERITKRMENI